ncbi:MAG: family 16 glycosylhydrolase [Oscillospiraceae bacterium]|nr:family 16 glycosylhydrolase [Oscillospiraceae bacterium]
MRRMTRNVLAIALAILMAISILPIQAFATPAVGTNLLTNGDFQTLLVAPPSTWTTTAGHGWNVYRDNIPAFSFEMVEDEGQNTQVVNIPALGSTFWHIQLHQRAQLTVGTTYRLSVTARSNEARNITVEIGALAAASGGGARIVTLGTEYTTWVHEFTPVAAPTHADGANFMLHLGMPAANVPATPNQVFLREVSLVAVGDEPGPTVDKSALIETIGAAQARVETSYTSESWASMQSALAAAIIVRDDEEATQVQVDGARQALLTALNALDRLITIGDRQPAPDFARNPYFRLVWEDDFSEPYLDETIWHVQTGTGGHYNLSGWGNDELQYYRRENVSIRNNMLLIQARRENHGGMNFTSARIRTGGTMPASGADAPAEGFTGISTMFGRIEASIALPVGQGMWPAFWMLPEDSLYGGWPMGGEIDIMEARGRQPSIVTGALHWGTSPSSSWRAGNHALVGRTIYDFNVYAVEWEPSQIRWYVNDVNYFTINMTDANTWWSREPGFPNTSAAANFTRPAPFDQPFHMLLNLAIGGNFDGGLAPPADFQSAEMWVDYVRIFEWDGPEFGPVPGATAEVHPTDNTLKSTLRDGNIIWNGTFDRGVNRLGFWNLIRNNDVTATFYVADDPSQHPNRPRKLEVSGISESAAVSDIQLVQTRIPMHNEVYRLEFDAMVATARNIVFEVADMNGNVVHTAAIPLTTTMERRAHEFTLSGIENGAEMQVRFNFGGNTADVTMDNVFLRRLTFLSVDYTGVNVFPLWNGDFFAGITGWNTAGEISYPFTVQDGFFTATINTLGASPWYNQLESPVMSIPRGHEFIVEFDAWAQNPREMQVVVEPPPWGTRQLDEIVSLSTERQTFRMPAFMAAGAGDGSQDLQLKFLMGNVPPTSVTGRIYISNIRVFIQQDQFRQIPTFYVVPISGPRVPGVDMDLRYNAAFDPIFNAVEKTVRIGVFGNFVTVPTIIDNNNGNLRIPGEFITRGGNLTIEITADGFAPLTLTQTVTDNNMLRNGVFSVAVTAAGNGWTRTTDGGNVAQGTGVNLQRFRAANQAALGTTPHSTMLRQSVYLEAGVEYALSLAARAGTNAARRDITVQVGGNPVAGNPGLGRFVIPIESINAAEPTAWNTIITVEEDGPVYFYLLLGRHETGLQPTGTNVDMWLSEIRLAPARAEPPDVPGRRPLPPNVGPCSDMWTLTWSDEFDGDDLDETRWHVQTGTGAQYGIVGWGNAELQYYRRQNVSVRDGNLVIRGQREDAPIAGRNFTSARIRTGGERASGVHDPFNDEFEGFSQAYGRFEASIALPDIEGMWPAFWMLPQNSLYGGWPMGGEIDIMEAMGRLPGEASSAVHFGGPWPGVHQYRMAVYHFETGSFPDRNITDFNLYAVEWEPGQMRWYINGDLYHTRNSEEWFSRGNNTSAPFSSPAPFDQPFHILLNMAMGGNFDPLATIPADFEYAEMLVEFVRVYELTGRDLIQPGEGGEEEKDEYPEGSKEPDETGNFTRGNDFANVSGPYNQAIDGAPVHQDGWIVTYNGGGAGGNVTGISVGDDDLLHIAIGAGGGQPWAIQMMQFVPLAQGRHYQFTFDARAQAPRNIAANIGAGGEGGNWSTYAGQSFTLATETRTFSYQFTMLDPSHARARVEFNMGGNANDIWIGNVRIEEIPYRTFEEPIKTPIGTGANMNHVWNGTFDQGPNFMGFWNPIVADAATATFEVPDCVSWHPPHWPLQPSAPFRPRQLHVTDITGAAPEDVMMTQTLIPMFRDTYRIEFLGSATSARDIVFRVADMEGNVFYTGTITLDTEYILRTHEFTLTQPNPDNRHMQIQFLFGGNEADVVMDNVFLRRLTDGDGNLLRNGLFSAQVTAADNGWTRTVDGGNVAQGTGGNVQRFRATNLGVLGTTPQATRLSQSVDLQAGIIYELTFAARAGSNAARRDVTVQIGDIQTLLVSVESIAAADPTTVTYRFTVPADQTVDISILLGLHETGRQPTGTNIDMWLSEIRLMAVGEVVPPTDFSGTNPNHLRALLQDGDATVQTRGNLGIFTQHSPFVVPAGRTLYVETTLNIQRDAELIIEGRVVVLPGGRINNQGSPNGGGTIIIEESGILINDGHVENVSNSTVYNYGTIINNARFEVRARTVFINEGKVDGDRPLNTNRDAILYRLP